MTINDGDVVEEVVELHGITSTDALHSLMVEKGFQLKSPVEVQRIQTERQAQVQKQTVKANKLRKAEKFILFGIILVLLLGCYSCFYCFSRRRRKREENKI